jgi:hypothetical protein
MLNRLLDPTSVLAESAGDIYKQAGFPGLLVFLGAVAVGLIYTPGVHLDPLFGTIIACVSFGTGATTYIVERLHSLRLAQAKAAVAENQARLVFEFLKPIVEKWVAQPNLDSAVVAKLATDVVVPFMKQLQEMSDSNDGVSVTVQRVSR